jgi:hypothetical protein
VHLRLPVDGERVRRGPRARASRGRRLVAREEAHKVGRVHERVRHAQRARERRRVREQARRGQRRRQDGNIVAAEHGPRALVGRVPVRLRVGGHLLDKRVARRAFEEVGERVGGGATTGTAGGTGSRRHGGKRAECGAENGVSKTRRTASGVYEGAMRRGEALKRER